MSDEIQNSIPEEEREYNNIRAGEIHWRIKRASFLAGEWMREIGEGGRADGPDLEEADLWALMDKYGKGSGRDALEVFAFEQLNDEKLVDQYRAEDPAAPERPEGEHVKATEVEWRYFGYNPYDA